MIQMLKMDEDHKLNFLKSVVTSTPYGRGAGSMWDMLNSVISPIGNSSDNVINEKKLLPRATQKISAPRLSGQQPGLPVLSSKNYLAEYRSSIKHTATQSPFPRLEIIESDDDDDEVIPKIVKVDDKNVVKPLKKKEISEPDTLKIPDKGGVTKSEHKISESVEEFVSKAVVVEDKAGKTKNEPNEVKRLRKTEVHVLRPKRISVKEGPSPSNEELNKNKKSMESINKRKSELRTVKRSKKISLPPTKQTFQKENEPSIVVVDTPEIVLRKSCRLKTELNGLKSTESSVLKPSEQRLKQDVSEPAGKEKNVSSGTAYEACSKKNETRKKTDSSESKQIPHREAEVNHCDKNKNDLKNDGKRSSPVLRSQRQKGVLRVEVKNLDVKENESPISAVTADTGVDNSRVHSLRKRKISLSPPEKQTKKEENVPVEEAVKASSVQLNRNNVSVNKTQNTSDSVVIIEVHNNNNIVNDVEKKCTVDNSQKPVRHSTVLHSGGNKVETAEGDKGNRELPDLNIQRKRVLTKMISPKDGNVLRDCKAWKALQEAQQQGSQLKGAEETSTDQKCFSTFEEAIFHKQQGVAIATCVSVANFTAGYIEIDRRNMFSSKTTSLLLHVLEGEPDVTINETTKRVKHGTFLYIPPGASYQIKNSGSKRVCLSYTKVAT